MDCPKCGAPNPDTQPFCGKCGSSLPPAAPASAASDASTRTAPHRPDSLDTGTTFAGRYQIIEELGRGGMGRVYKVIDQEIHAKVALKLIRPEIAFDQATIDRFRQELTTARAISHKNICRMYDLGRHGTTYFLTMEYVAGEDLKSMIAMTGQLGVGTAISIAKQVCDGLAEAHRLGVIHRDLKPQNIQIDKGGQAKIMDFGIARSVKTKGLTDGGMALGTPPYMSPEQAEARGVDARSDLYSLGVILYEMLTGRVPFDGDTPLAVAMKHKLEAPRDPLELNASIPADLGRLILKCLEKDKERRYQNASEVHADLVRIEQRLPTTAKVVPQSRPATSKQITVQFTMRQLLVPALVIVALVAISVGAWRLWPRTPAKVAPQTSAAGKPMLAVLYFENISGDPALNTWRTGLPELLITSLSQSRLLNVVSSDSIYSILKKLNLVDAKRFSAEDLAGVAKEGNAQYLLTGSVMKAGQRTVITARLQKAATGEVIRSEKIECLKDEEILTRVDELAKGIKADLNLSPQEILGDISQPVGQVLTSSPEALKYYTEAQRLHLKAAYRDAISLYERAIAADPGFAMAYRGLAVSYANLGQRAKRVAAVKKALELSDRLPERFWYHVQLTANYASTATFPQVIDAGNKLLAKYPDDILGLHYLGLVYGDVEEYQECADLREAVMKVTPTYVYAYNLAVVYEQLGRYDKAKSTLESYVERDPTNAGSHVSLGRSYLITRQFAEAQRESEKATILAPRSMGTVLFKGDVALLRGDFAASEREYSSILGQGAEAERRAAQFRLGLLDLTRGRFEKAREQVRASIAEGITNSWLGWVELEAGHPDLAVKAFQAVLADPAVASNQRNALAALSGLGLSHVAVGDIARAQKALDDLKAFPEGVFVKPKNRMSLLLSGALAAKRGDGRTAVADLERAAGMLPYQANARELDKHAGIFDLLARGYMVAGDLVRARETYEKITALTTGRLGFGATYARSFYHLGLIAERQGDKPRAREQFQKFLDLWKDADKGLPEVADARKRMAQ
jgi:serine/threonine protein kinase/tetratricopeptide (TPR) repeat protein